MSHRKGLRALLAASLVSATALTVSATAYAATPPAQSSATPSGKTTSAGALTPSGYTANGTPIYNLRDIHLRPGTAQPLSQHACAARPDPTGIDQAVFCSDLLVYSNGTVQPQAEGACQIIGSSSYPQCANIDLIFGMYIAGPILIGGPYEGVCGHQNGPCPTPRLYLKGNTTGPPAGSCWEAWTVVSTASVIQLPVTDHKVSPTSNVSSGHAIICS